MTRKFGYGLVAGALLAAATAGCAVMPAFPAVVAHPEQTSIINLRTIRSTVDRSLQDTVAISFIPPQAMAIDRIEYAIGGRPVARDEFDLVLQTSRLRIGDHVIELLASGDGKVVRGTTHLTVIESGLTPESPDSAAAAGTYTPGSTPAGSTAGAPQQGNSGGQSGGTPVFGQTGSGSGDGARVSIKIRLPEE